MKNIPKQSLVFLFVFFLMRPLLWAVEVSIQLEYAIAAEERNRGLMNRDKLEENSGMLFVFAYPQFVNMWMKNTKIPLSVAFLDSRGIIREIYDMNAYIRGEKVKRGKNFSAISGFPAKYALEVNQGWFKKNHIGVGDRLLWRYPSKQGKIIVYPSEFKIWFFDCIKAPGLNRS